MSNSAIFQDFELVPGLSKAQYWDALLLNLADADTVEVIKEPDGNGGHEITFRLWFGVRADGSNDPDADPNAVY